MLTLTNVWIILRTIKRNGKARKLTASSPVFIPPVTQVVVRPIRLIVQPCNSHDTRPLITSTLYYLSCKHASTKVLHLAIAATHVHEPVVLCLENTYNRAQQCDSPRWPCHWHGHPNLRRLTTLTIVSIIFQTAEPPSPPRPRRLLWTSTHARSPSWWNCGVVDGGGATKHDIANRSFATCSFQQQTTNNDERRTTNKNNDNDDDDDDANGTL